MNNQPVTVTSPLLPPLEELIPYLQKIWDSKWITNNGAMHKELERQLAEYLGVEYISLFSNGTLALMTALKALNVAGEVITTPYSFVATAHAIVWNNLQPVFADVEPQYYNLDPQKIEAAITERTTAIMPVHVYGNPCNVEAIQQIAEKHHLKVIYDAAHAFGVKKDGVSILKYGDLSVLSFHATKVYSTIEGGAVVCHSQEMKHHIDNLKNFGFRGETTVEEVGINAKLNELQAAFGLLNLKYIDNAIQKRRQVAETYKMLLQHIKGISFLPEQPHVLANYAYFPVFVNEEEYGMSRDDLYEKLRAGNIYGRRYFYPLITSFEPYKSLPSAQNLPVAEKAAQQVICLPLYADLSEEEIRRVVNVVEQKEV